jgi:hypothetical protein
MKAIDSCVILILDTPQSFGLVFGGPRQSLRRHASCRTKIAVEQRVDETVAFEQGQVLWLLAQAHVLDGQMELLADGDHDAALGRAVQLGQDDAGTTGSFGKSFRLTDPVLTGRRIQHQQNFVRRFGNLLGDHAVDLGQLTHQIGLRLQPPRRVDDADVRAGLQRLSDCPVRDAGRIAARRAGDDRHADPLGPDRQLLDRRGAKRVGRRHERPPCLALSGNERV